MRLATKNEIDDMVAAKGFRDNWNGQGAWITNGPYRALGFTSKETNVYKMEIR